ncbi:hypothetical protein SAMN05880570_4645 [Paenibacillus sp. RU4T]|nr:hypothetical protein SAMN05880555_4643 [Paenibacillus sp. RU4X]SIR74454.1 hypothetical protein SAMN05880570_4645 [Paenibacillus sp. RU4T]
MATPARGFRVRVFFCLMEMKHLAPAAKKRVSAPSNYSVILCMIWKSAVAGEKPGQIGAAPLPGRDP